MRVLVVDDEPLARETLVSLIAEDEHLELAGSCSDGLAAEAHVQRDPPDLIFLDIEMPRQRGIEFLRGLRQRPLWSERLRPEVVFVTAHAEHAALAFELEASDYLLKPFSDARFREVVERARCRQRDRQRSRAARGEEPGADRHDYLERLSIKRRGSHLLVPVDEVEWIESDDYCVRVHSEQGSHLLRASLNLLEERLDPTHFLRVHRGAIVRLDRIVQVERVGGSGRSLELASGARVPVARSRVKAVLERVAPALDVR